MKFNKLLITVLCLLVISCRSIGPAQVYMDRNRYNDVIQDTNNQQLLENIVRIRYIDPISFLKLSNITASYNINPNINGTFGGATPRAIATPNIPFIFNTALVQPEIHYSDSPTITYIPVADNEFVSEIMSPVTLQNLHLFTYGGSGDIETRMNIAIQELNGIHNARSLSNAKINKVPTVKRFRHLISLIAKAYDDRKLDLRASTYKGHYIEHLKITPAFKRSRDYAEILRVLKIPNNGKKIILTDSDIDAPDMNVIRVHARSTLGMLTFLSHAVDVPKEHVKAHYVHQFTDMNGKRINISHFLKGFMRIYTSKQEPDDAFVKCYLHYNWFYIKNSDLDSKATFSFVTRVMMLTARNLYTGTNGPMLTLPAH